MPCRIGITTNPARRRAEWESEYPSLYGWEQRGPYSERSDAQRAETSLALEHDCEAAPGGADPDSGRSWYVYKFNY